MNTAKVGVGMYLSLIGWDKWHFWGVIGYGTITQVLVLAIVNFLVCINGTSFNSQETDYVQIL